MVDSYLVPLCLQPFHILPNRVAHIGAAWQPGWEEMERERGNGERERETPPSTSYSSSSFLFPLYLSLSCRERFIFLPQEPQFMTFVLKAEKCERTHYEEIILDQIRVGGSLPIISGIIRSTKETHLQVFKKGNA